MNTITLKSHIKEFANDYHWIKDNTRNRCIDISCEFLKKLGYTDMHNYMQHGIINGEEHHWVKIGELNIDFTANQYDKSSDFPLLWEGDGHPLNY